jgi:hypothetical protein
MRKLLCLLALSWPIVACNDIVDFLNDRPPCRDDCLKKPGFQNCQNCKCQAGQESIPEHVCCQGGTCIKPPAALDPACMNPADGSVYLAIAQPFSIPDQPDCGTPFQIRWGYKNTSQGSLPNTTAKNLPVPFLNLHEETGPDSQDTIYPNQGWPDLDPCGETVKLVNVPELIPTTSSVGTYIAQVRQLPENTIGTDFTSIRVNATLSSPTCPPP